MLKTQYLTCEVVFLFSLRELTIYYFKSFYHFKYPETEGFEDHYTPHPPLFKWEASCCTPYSPIPIPVYSPVCSPSSVGERGGRAGVCSPAGPA